MDRAEIVKYALSKDKKGLLAYFKREEPIRKKPSLVYYHIHSNELTSLEKWIKGLLKKCLKK